MTKPQSASQATPHLAAENSKLPSAAEQERVLREAAQDRADAQGRLLAALFTLPGRVGAWRLPDQARHSFRAALARCSISLRRARGTRLGHGR